MREEAIRQPINLGAGASQAVGGANKDNKFVLSSVLVFGVGSTVTLKDAGVAPAGINFTLAGPAYVNFYPGLQVTGQLVASVTGGVQIGMEQ